MTATTIKVNTAAIPAYKVQVPDYLSVHNPTPEPFEEVLGWPVTFHAYTPAVLASLLEMADKFDHPILVEPIPFDKCRDGEWFQEPIS